MAPAQPQLLEPQTLIAVFSGLAVLHEISVQAGPATGSHLPAVNAWID